MKASIGVTAGFRTDLEKNVGLNFSTEGCRIFHIKQNKPWFDEDALN
jgi:hypothetical protein